MAEKNETYGDIITELMVKHASAQGEAFVSARDVNRLSSAHNAEIARLTAENRALQAKIDAALAIPQSEPSIAAFYQAYNAGADHMRREFRKALEGK